MTQLSGKVAIVTGGSSGIGRAAALGLAAEGAKVLVTARHAGPLDETVAAHPNIAGLVADVASPEDALRTVTRAVERWGRLDVLINNAGAGAILRWPTPRQSASRRSCCERGRSAACSPRRRFPIWPRRRGRSSMSRAPSVTRRRPGYLHYAASKAALDHLTRCWALELAPQGIRVNAVAAGPTESGALTGMMGLSPQQAAAIEEQEREQIPLKRRGKPEDVARWIVRLASGDADWVTGQVLAVDGGLSIT